MIDALLVGHEKFLAKRAGMTLVSNVAFFVLKKKNDYR
jgi:hypothetical protein